jgi:glyoxalase family protein
MTKGIHHITAIASSAQKNVDFYTKLLGLRLVKKSVNQDDTATYHFFFGDRLGEPGMDLTFFIFLPSMQGVRGNGLVTKISLAVPSSSLSFWQKRLSEHNVDMHTVVSQFGHDRLTFFDADGQQLELVGVGEKELGDASEVWTTKEVGKPVAIRHFHSATLSVESLGSIDSILTRVFGYTKIDQHDHVHLYRAQAGNKRAELLEVSETPSLGSGLGAAGTVHHIAFRADHTQHQLALRQKVVELGLYPTEVINRFYFQSVYFRTPAGILFEIATDGPGFTADEKEEELGKRLALPPFLEPEREEIEKRLLPIDYAV